jgi:hypothetical protein
MVFSAEQLTEAQKTAGQFCNHSIFRDAYRIAKQVDMNALPLVIGIWADETRLSLGSMCA